MVPVTDREGLLAPATRNATGGGGPSAAGLPPTASTDTTPGPRSTTPRRTSIITTNLRMRTNTVTMPSIAGEQATVDQT